MSENITWTHQKTLELTCDFTVSPTTLERWCNRSFGGTCGVNRATALVTKRQLDDKTDSHTCFRKLMPWAKLYTLTCSLYCPRHWLVHCFIPDIDWFQPQKPLIHLVCFTSRFRCENGCFFQELGNLFHPIKIVQPHETAWTMWYSS